MVPARRLAAVYFAYFAFVGAFSPYFGLYLQSIGMTAWQIGALLAEMQFMRVFAPNAWGWLADRTGQRTPFLRLAMLLATLAFSGLFFASAFVPLALVLALQAFSSGGANPLIESITLGHLRGELQRYGAIRLWGSVGFIITVLAVGYQLDRLPASTLLWSVFATLLATFALTLVAIPDSPTRHAAKGVPVMDVLRRPEVIAFFVACFFMTVAHGPLYAFYSIYLAGHGYSKSVIGVLWSLGVLAEIVVFWLMPAWSLRFSMRQVLIASFACAVLRFVLIGWGVDSLLVLIFAQVLHGATFGSYHAAALALVNQWFRHGREVRGQALYASISFGAGGMLGAAASGIAWEALGPAWTFSLASTAAGAGLLALVIQRKMTGNEETTSASRSAA